MKKIVIFLMMVQVAYSLSPLRGLWVGQVALDGVNEATGAVGDSNTLEFTDPETVTPTRDTAYLRIILHVNGSGQASILKSVAVVPTGEESDQGGDEVLLVTDPSLYVNYPVIARRIATAFYDFGENQAVDAVQFLIDTAVSEGVANASADVQALTGLIDNLLNPIQTSADVNNLYLSTGTGSTSFISTGFFTLAELNSLAVAVHGMSAEDLTDLLVDLGDLSENLNTSDADIRTTFSSLVPIRVLDAALAHRGVTEDSVFYNDTRGIEAISRILYVSAIAVEAGKNLPEVQAIARAEWLNAADVDLSYNRFLASGEYASLAEVVIEEAVAVALLANSLGENEASITEDVMDALLTLPEVQAASNLAQTILSSSPILDGEQDDRAVLLLNNLLQTLSAEVANQVQSIESESQLNTVVTAFFTLMIDSVTPGYVLQGAPSQDYTDFVTGTDYDDAVDTLTSEVASEIAFQFGAGVTSVDALTFNANRAAETALSAIRNSSAQIINNEIELSGAFGQELTGRLVLPALAPTNPFLHRLHPDHTSGIEITREIAMTFDDTGVGSSGYGVTNISGVYEEEIFGLHRELGANRDTGLKTRGAFTLERISLRDSINF